MIICGAEVVNSRASGIIEGLEVLKSVDRMWVEREDARPLTVLRRLDWVNAPFLAWAHAMAALGLVLAWWLPVSGGTLALALVWLACCGLSITGGYHRLFSHATYRAHPAVRLFYLLFGAASAQNSALKWSADHRRHHQFTDQEADPYNIRRGFWWAHIGWVLVKEPPTDYARVPDLAADPLVRFQHRWYVPLAIGMGWLAPAAIGSLWGDALGAFFWCGWIRLVVQWHSTFSVNYFAHWIGRQTYSAADSSRDSFVTAMITMGEGYHNFHHSFPWDYRNGVGRHQFDPTKWAVAAMARVGLTWGLRRAEAGMILRARLAMDQRRMQEQLARAGWRREVWDARIVAARAALEQLLERWQDLRARYAERSSDLGARAKLRLRILKGRMRAARAEFQEAYRLWRACVRRPELLAAGA
jgi:stearoyl-CoA desaturase (delta-9 desaturase)